MAVLLQIAACAQPNVHIPAFNIHAETVILWMIAGKPAPPPSRNPKDG
jgi:hypothetical protein